MATSSSSIERATPGERFETFEIQKMAFTMKRLKICLINPKFEPSYWGFDYALPLYPGNKKCTMTTGALAHLAGLVPDHEVYLLDENVEQIDFEFLKEFDIVGVTGMIVQRDRMREILKIIRQMGAFAVVGGAYASVDEPFFDGLCDVLFSGEADETWPEFVKCFATGKKHKTFYKQEDPTDMTRAPKPRVDLLKVDRYASGSLQFSRGCPFQCEFCDIIVTFGRRPRVKTAGQVLAELDALRAQGVRVAFIVDDNLIGNRKAIAALLSGVIAWQERHGYPMTFFTEASIDLADDPGLMRLMVDANIASVFVGIESPNEASLRETKKLQNVRPTGTIVERVHRIQKSGIEVWCGMILGFDNDDATIFEAQ